MAARCRWFTQRTRWILRGLSSTTSTARTQQRRQWGRQRRHSNFTLETRSFKTRRCGSLVPRPASLYSTMETVLDSQAIQKLLPHRYPFLLVDRIIELVPRVRIVGIKQVSINEPFFQGHFPGAPVMPGVLVVEALAQVGAVLALREIEDRDQKLVLFTGIKEARFRRPVVPGDTLFLEVTAVRIGSRVQRMRGEAKVDGILAADADIMSIITERQPEKVKRD